MTELFLSRVRLRRDASVRALAPLLLPEGQARTAAAHRLIWALFADDGERTRDFLWREERPGHFLTLSSRAPAPMDLFDVESTGYAPALAAGDRLGFALRANAVIARKDGEGRRGRRHDVVMDALHGLPLKERAEARLDAVATAGRAWLARQGAQHGFTPDPVTAVDGYDRMRVDRDLRDERGQRIEAKPAIFGVIDFSGALRVDDPARFLAAIGTGFGRARAFGCGLMLIRRIPPPADEE